MTDQIDFACVLPEHHGTFILHRGAFGYCPHGAAADHDWRPTSPATNNWSATVDAAVVRAGGSPECAGEQR